MIDIIQLPLTIKAPVATHASMWYGMVDGRAYPRFHLGGRRRDLSEMDNTEERPEREEDVE